MKEFMVFQLVLFVLGALSVHLVSWIGSVLYSVPNAADGGYAVFTFRGDQDLPMSTNLLMNVLFPNVVLVLLHLTWYQFRFMWPAVHLGWYVAYYFAYRMVLICIVLRRKELYSLPYEFTNTSLGIVIAYFLNQFLFADPSAVFLPVSELVNEFWLIVLLLIYKFCILLLDKMFHQKSVVGEKRLNRYIFKKFDLFYHKFKDITDVCETDRHVWILLYSIMIFEDYNRGPFLRAIERIKILCRQEATVGIMQIRSDHVLSDRESIVAAYNLLRNDIMLADPEIDDEEQIKYYALQYNPDVDYAESVAFIYTHLKDYIQTHPVYSKKFYSKQKNQSISLAVLPTIVQLTIEDLVQITGLKYDDIFEKLKDCETAIVVPTAEE